MEGSRKSNVAVGFVAACFCIAHSHRTSQGGQWDGVEVVGGRWWVPQRQLL